MTKYPATAKQMSMLSRSKRDFHDQECQFSSQNQSETSLHVYAVLEDLQNAEQVFLQEINNSNQDGLNLETDLIHRYSQVFNQIIIQPSSSSRKIKGETTD